MPRIAASAGDLLHPTPDGGSLLDGHVGSDPADRPKRGSDALRQVEQQVISRALGRDLAPNEIPKLNRAALGQEISEVLGAQVYAKAYAALYAIYDRQRRDATRGFRSVTGDRPVALVERARRHGSRCASPLRRWQPSSSARR